jgi:hypothetical protein
MTEALKSFDAALEDRRSLPRRVSDERRLERRERVYLAAVLLIPGEDAARGATILNRSSAGAKLRVGDVSVLPERFTLVDQRSCLAHECRVVWRAMPDVGVAFDRTLDLSKDQSGLARRLNRS